MTTVRPILALAAAVSLVLAACGPAAGDPAGIAPLPEASPNEISAILATGDRPVVLNVWASWCIPCRSEAPLLRRAHEELGEEVRFIGVDVRDSQDDARAFIAEFGIDGFEHYFDRAGAIPAALAGVGVPLTYFFSSDGTLVRLHHGVIDERTLALEIDEIVRQSH